METRAAATQTKVSGSMSFGMPTVGLAQFSEWLITKTECPSTRLHGSLWL